MRNRHAVLKRRRQHGFPLLHRLQDRGAGKDQVGAVGDGLASFVRHQRSTSAYNAATVLGVAREALRRAYAASGKSPAEFADMYGLDLRTVTAAHRGEFALACAFLAQQNGGFNATPARDARAPLSTIQTTGSQQALDLLRAGAAPDAILMDINMPGLDGFATTRLLRELPGPIAWAPVLATLAVIGIVYGALVAMVQPDMNSILRPDHPNQGSGSLSSTTRTPDAIRSQRSPPPAGESGGNPRRSVDASESRH